MHPVLLRAGSWEFRSYPAAIGLAALLGLAYFLYLCREDRLPRPRDRWLLANLVVFCGIVCGRLFALAEGLLEPEAGTREPTLTLSDHGVPTFGVLAGVLLGCWIFSKLAAFPLPRALDLVFLVVPLCHGLARIGCFLAGCCYGRPADPSLPWAVTYQSDQSLVETPLLGHPLHPTQLYESLGDFALAAALLALDRHRRTLGTPRQGSVCLVYFAGYGALRLVTDCFRGDRVTVPGLPLTPAQVLAIGSLCACAVILVARRLRHPGPGVPLA